MYFPGGGESEESDLPRGTCTCMHVYTHTYTNNYAKADCSGQIECTNGSGVITVLIVIGLCYCVFTFVFRFFGCGRQRVLPL